MNLPGEAFQIFPEEENNPSEEIHRTLRSLEQATRKIQATHAVEAFQFFSKRRKLPRSFSKLHFAHKGEAGKIFSRPEFPVSIRNRKSSERFSRTEREPELVPDFHGLILRHARAHDRAKQRRSLREFFRGKSESKTEEPKFPHSKRNQSNSRPTFPQKGRSHEFFFDNTTRSKKVFGLDSQIGNLKTMKRKPQRA